MCSPFPFAPRLLLPTLFTFPHLGPSAHHPNTHLLGFLLPWQHFLSSSSSAPPSIISPAPPSDSTLDPLSFDSPYPLHCVYTDHVPSIPSVLMQGLNLKCQHTFASTDTLQPTEFFQKVAFSSSNPYLLRYFVV